MQIAAMRSEVAKRYPSLAWRNRVAKMSDNQVFVIYTRLKSKGEIK